VARYLQTLETYVVLSGALALALLGLLRSGGATLPLATFSCALVLFMVPGVVLVRRFFAEHVSGVSLVPVAFTISAGVFAAAGVPFLIMHGSIGLYLWFAGAILVASLAVAVLGVIRRKPTAENGAFWASLSFNWLWVPFVLLGAVLASMSRLRVRGALGDTWVYAAWVQEFLHADKLALHEPYFGDRLGTSRAQINGWLLEQAAFSKVSGIEPVTLIFGYLKPVLVVVSLLMFYALCRILLKSDTAALLGGCFYALFFLVNLVPFSGGYGAEFIGRVAEDKFVARYLYFPAALIFAYLFLENRKARYLVVFASLCWVVVAVHPVGLAIIGLSVGGFGLLHLAMEWRKKEAWLGVLSLGGALLSVLISPLLYVLATGESLVAALQDADINSGDPDVLRNIVFVLRKNTNIYELGDGSYIMQPALLLTTAIAVSLVAGLPFLLWRVKDSLAARLLLGMLVVSIVVCYVPPVATFFGDHIVSPGQLWRLAWPIPLAAFVTLGWMVWELARIGLLFTEGTRRGALILPLVVLCALIVSAPASLNGIEQVYGAAQSRSNPIFSWMGDNIEKPGVVMAPDYMNISIPAYSAQANVVSSRGGLILRILPALQRRAPGKIDVPQGALDVRDFYHRSSREERIQIIKRQKVDYVMARSRTRLSINLNRQPGLTLLDTAGKGYRLYAVDRGKLEQPGENARGKPPSRANSG